MRDGLKQQRLTVVNHQASSCAKHQGLSHTISQPSQQPLVVFCFTKGKISWTG